MAQHRVEERPQENKDKNISSKSDTSDYHDNENIEDGIKKLDL